MSQKLDPRVLRTRKLIEDAFIKLWSQKSLSRITIQDITQEAAINRVTFYAHFQDKYELCDYFIQNTFEAFLQNYLPADAPLTRENFHQLSYATIKFVLDLRRDCVAPSEDFSPYIETRVQSIIFNRLMAWIQEDYLIVGCKAGAEIAATAISWAIFGIAVRLSEQKKTTASVAEVSTELVNMLAMGLWNSLGQFQPDIILAD